MEHPIGEMMHSTMNSIKDMVDVNTVVGDPVVAATGATIIPVSRVCFGYVTGGGRSAGQREEQNASADGAGNVSLCRRKRRRSIGAAGRILGRFRGRGAVLPAQPLTVADRMVELLLAWWRT